MHKNLDHSALLLFRVNDACSDYNCIIMPLRKMCISLLKMRINERAVLKYCKLTVARSLPLSASTIKYMYIGLVKHPG